MKKKRGSIVKKVLIGTGVAGSLVAAGIIGGRHYTGARTVRYAHGHSKQYRTSSSVRKTPLKEWKQWWS
jgi:hypothetical protein